MEKLTLGAIVDQKADGHPLVTGVRELTVKECENHQRALESINEFWNNLQLLQIVKLNYEDYESILSQIRNEYHVSHQMNFSIMRNSKLKINRCILNLLSSIRSFLDQYETNLKRKYGDSSEELKLFKSICSEQYDAEFAYKFCYKLRNYAQHVGMPLGQVSINSELDETDKAITQIEVMFDRDYLIDSYDSWGAELTKDIKRQNEFFDINMLLQKMMDCINEISLEVSRIELVKVLPHAEFLVDLVNSIGNKNAFPCMLETQMIDDQHVSVKMSWLPLDMLEMISRMQLKIKQGSD